jgi:predicted phage tail protein
MRSLDMRTVRLYGDLAEFTGRSVIEAEVSTAAEAVRMLVANWPAIEQHMATRFYRVLWGEQEIALQDHPEQLHWPAGEHEEIRIVPVVGGAGGNSGVWQILAGVALIALAFVPGIGAVAGAAALKFTALGTISAGIGASLVLGGVSQMITPMQALNAADESDPRRNYSFSGVQNSSRQGFPVPIGYGEMLIGSVMVSQGVITDDVDDREDDG